MTNPKDLENHMIADPVDDRILFDRDFQGEELFTCDEIRQLVLDGVGYLFKAEDADKLLAQLKKHNSSLLLGQLTGVYAGELIDMLFQDGGYETPLDMLNDLGAIIINEGDAA